MRSPVRPTPRRRHGLTTLVVRPGLLRLENRVLPAVFVVNSFVDGMDVHPGDGIARTADGLTTLRAAVMEANALTGADTIVLPAGTYVLSISGAGTAGNIDTAALGDLDLTDAIIVQGPGAGATRIQGQGLDRLFDVHPGVVALIGGLTLAGGSADAGGAVRSAGVLTLDRCTFTANSALAGGALAVMDQGSTTVTGCLFLDNSADRYGGAVAGSDATLSVSGSAFLGNRSPYGGAVALFGGSATLAASTFSANEAGGAGGAVYADLSATVRLFGATVVANRSAVGGGLFAIDPVQVRDTILAGNLAADGPDAAGPVASLGYNLVGDGSGSSGFGAAGDRVGSAAAPLDPRLSTLGDHGGPTPTYVPLPGSPALDAGSASAAADQRGVGRPQGGRPDIGAVEARPFRLVSDSGGQRAAIGTAFAPLGVRLLEGDDGLDGVAVTFVAPAGPGPGGTFTGTTTVLTGTDGGAAAPPLTANTTTGNFSVRVTAAGVPALDLPLTNDPGPAVAMDLSGAPAARAGQAFALTVTMRDAFGNRATGYTGTVRFASTDLRAGLPDIYTFTPADQGTKTFQVTFRTAGARTLSVYDMVTGFTAATAVTVTPAAVSRFDFTAPENTRAGQAVPVAITAFDAFGNRATNYTGTVVVRSEDTQAKLPGAYTFTAADQGTKTLQVVLRTAGSQGLTLTDSGAGLDAQTGVEVAPADASRFDLSAPTAARAGQASAITVTAFDAFGNRATDYSGTMKVRSDDPQAGLPGAYTFTVADGGVKTFQVTFRTAGGRSVSITDPGAGFTATAAVAVTPADASRFQLTAPSAPVRAGEAFAVTLTALDAFGNRATGYTGIVRSASDDPLAGLPGAYTFSPADQGARTFHVTLRTAGARGLSMIDPSAALSAAAAVAVTPAAASRFVLVAPPTADERTPFAVTITALDIFGNRTFDFTGTVTFSSDDPRAVLPAPVRFAPDDAGRVTVPGVVLRSPGLHTLRASAGTAVMGEAVVAVGNFGPGSLKLAPIGGINEGQSVTLLGNFTNPDDQDRHTVVIRWGDGTPDTILALGPGVFAFRTDHAYADNFAGANGRFPVRVTVTDAAGAGVTADTSVAVANVAPALGPLDGSWITDADQPYRAQGSFTDPGSDAWSATVDYGAGAGPQALPLSAGRRFSLQHDYATEGTFTVVVRVRDGDGGESVLSERVAVFLPGTTDVHAVEVPPGGTASVTSGGVTATLTNGSKTASVTVLLGRVSLDTIRGLAGSPTNDPTAQVLAFDLRVLGADLDSTLSVTVRFHPLATPGAAPELLYFDPDVATFLPVQGSSAPGSPAGVDPASANLRFALGATSAPTLRQLNGTLFALTVPPVPNATPPPSPRAETAFFVFAEQAVAPGATRDVAVLPKTAAATTGLVSSSGLTVSLAPADGLRRDGGGGGRVDDALSPQTLARAVRTMLGIRDFLKEAIQMWIEQPAPLEAALDPARLVELANRPPDMVQQAIPLPARVAAPPAVVDSIAVPVTGPTVMTEPVVAVAESHPWWLANCEKRPTENVPAETRSAEEQAVVEQPWEPSTADRVAALLTGLWLGGVALQVSAPERSTEEEKPAAPPKDKSDETEE